MQQMIFIFLTSIEVGAQWVASKVNVTPLKGVTNFALDPLRSYFDDCQKNENYFLNIYSRGSNINSCCSSFLDENHWEGM